jgi:anti-sigma regulatory factor (Ser/Thr protein kinase)
MHDPFQSNPTAPMGSELSIPARPSKLGAAREYAHSAALAFGLDSERSYEFALAANEAVTNAIRHGRPDERGHIQLSVRVEGDRLTFLVHDHGTFTASSLAEPDSAISGRGFPLMASLMDAVQLCVAPGSTTVRLAKARA